MMGSPESDKVFAGSVPKLYETYLVPLIFEPYAVDLAQRLSAVSLARVLEIAAGTGVVTRKLASVLPPSASITATDLNQPMLDLACRHRDPASGGVASGRCDATALRGRNI